MAKRNQKSLQQVMVDEIIERVNKVFGDTSVSQETTLYLMEQIEDVVDTNIVALKDDIRRKSEE